MNAIQPLARCESWSMSLEHLVRTIIIWGPHIDIEDHDLVQAVNLLLSGVNVRNQLPNFSKSEKELLYRYVGALHDASQAHPMACI